ncbi:unnamed protein product [Effrenium voratum]|nr:unnamed protein product [Effrenium voratum]
MQKCGTPAAQGVPLSELPIENFLTGYNVEERVMEQLKGLPRDQQILVMKVGTLKGANDVNAVLIKRMVNARHGDPGKGGKGGGWGDMSQMFAMMASMADWGGDWGGDWGWGGGKGNGVAKGAGGWGKGGKGFGKEDWSGWGKGKW